MAEQRKRRRVVWILWVVAVMTGGSAFAAPPTSRPVTQVAREKSHMSATQPTSQPTTIETVVKDAVVATETKTVVRSDSDVAVVSSDMEPVVKRMLSSIPGESAFLLSLRLDQVVSLRSFVQSSWSRWLGRAPQGGVAQILERPSTKKMLNEALSFFLGLRGKALEHVKKMVLLSDLSQPILVSPLWMSTEKFRDIALLGAVDFSLLLRDEKAFHEPVIAWVTIPTQDSRGWVSMLSELMETLNKPFPMMSPSAMGLKEGLILRLPRQRLLIVEAKEGFVRLAITSEIGLLAWNRNKKADLWEMEKLPRLLQQGPSSWRFTPALLHILQKKTFFGARVAPQVVKKVGVLIGMMEAGRAMPMATRQQQPRLAAQYAWIASEPWALFSSPKAEFEDVGWALSLQDKKWSMVGSFTQAGRAAYRAGTSNTAPKMAFCGGQQVVAKGTLDVDLPAILEGLRDAFPWSQGIVDRSLPLGADLWKEPNIRRRYAYGGLFMHPVLLGSGPLHVFRALLEAHPWPASILWRIPRRVKWVLGSLVGEERFLKGPSFGVALVFPPGKKAFVERWMHGRIPLFFWGQVREHWQSTPQGDCWMIGYRLDPKLLFDSCAKEGRPQATSRPSSSAESSGRWASTVVHLEPLLSMMRRYARWAISQRLLGSADRRLLLSMSPWLSSERLFGQAMSFYGQSGITSQAFWMQGTLQPTQANAAFPKMAVYSDAAPPLAYTKAWERSESPRRCFAQAQVLLHAFTPLLDRDVKKAAEVSQQLLPVIKRLAVCMEKESAFQPNAKRIRLFWKELSTQSQALLREQQRVEYEWKRSREFPLRAFVWDAQRRPIANVKIFVNNKFLGETDQQGSFRGTLQAKARESVVMKAVGVGVGNSMVLRNSTYLQDTPKGLVSSVIRFDFYLRSSTFHPRKKTYTTVRYATPIISGPLSKTAIRRVIQTAMRSFRYCYERELIRRPTLAGRVEVFFVISPKGTVTTAEIKRTTLNSPITEECIARRFGRLRFPAPIGGGIVQVRYPLVFRTSR